MWCPRGARCACAALCTLYAELGCKPRGPSCMCFRGSSQRQGCGVLLLLTRLQSGRAPAPPTPAAPPCPTRPPAQAAGGAVPRPGHHRPAALLLLRQLPGGGLPPGRRRRRGAAGARVRPRALLHPLSRPDPHRRSAGQPARGAGRPAAAKADTGHRPAPAAGAPDLFFSAHPMQPS